MDGTDIYRDISICACVSSNRYTHMHIYKHIVKWSTSIVTLALVSICSRRILKVHKQISFRLKREKKKTIKNENKNSHKKTKEYFTGRTLLLSHHVLASFLKILTKSLSNFKLLTKWQRCGQTKCNEQSEWEALLMSCGNPFLCLLPQWKWLGRRHCFI